MAVCKDPGFLQNGNTDFIQMVEVSESTQLCPDCLCVRTSRSRHCSVCNRCVERFDHHCPWINNCVGIQNHNYFYLYVSTISILMIFSCYHAVFILS